MRLIVGLGNPGIKYFDTRHNIGFRILDQFCLDHKLNFKPAKSDFWLVESCFETFHFFLVKPASYVNRSGIIIKELVDELNVSLSDLLIVYDDTNINVGELRIRKSGSDGGHNGLKSIIYYLENNKFNRLRVGVGEPQNSEDLAEYVLSPFLRKDFKIIEKKIPLIISLIENFIIGGVSKMLNYYSRETNIKSSKIS